MCGRRPGFTHHLAQYTAIKPAAGRVAGETQHIGNNACGFDFLPSFINHGQQDGAERRPAHQNSVKDGIQYVSVVFIEPVFMLVLVSQYAPVTKPPVHQSRRDGRFQRSGKAVRIQPDDFRYLREGGFQESQQIVTFRRRQPFLCIRQMKCLGVRQFSGGIKPFAGYRYSRAGVPASRRALAVSNPARP